MVSSCGGRRSPRRGGGRRAEAGRIGRRTGTRGERIAPRRTCVGCRRTALPSELVRITLGADGRLLVGPARPGRGAWLCRDSPRCLDQAERRDAFTRALRAPVRPGAVDGLRTLLVNSSSTPGRLVQVCEDGGPGRCASSRARADAREGKERP